MDRPFARSAGIGEPFLHPLDALSHHAKSNRFRKTFPLSGQGAIPCRIRWRWRGSFCADRDPFRLSRGRITLYTCGVSENRLRRNYGAVPERSRGTVDDPNAERVESLPDETESPIDALNRQDLLEVIEQSLQPIEWTVLKMHYLEGKSGKEVARELNLSASRICQIHVRVLSRLKSKLASLPV